MNLQDVLMVHPTSPLICHFYLTSLVHNLDLVTSLEPRATEDIKVSIKLISVDLPKGNRQNMERRRATPLWAGTSFNISAQG